MSNTRVVSLLIGLLSASTVIYVCNVPTSNFVQASQGSTYNNLRFVTYKLPPGPQSTVNAQDGKTGPDVYTGAVTLHNAGINGIRADGMSWTQYTILGTSGWQNAVNYEATAFDQQGISVVWGLPIWDDIRHIPLDLLFYENGPNPPSSSIPAYAFGGSGSNSISAAQSLFESNAIYWGQTTNTQYTAANGTVIPAGRFSWPWAAKYAGMTVWQAYISMLADTVPTLAKHPSTYALKLENEPWLSGWTSTELESYNSQISQAIRADGFNGYIDYMGTAAPATTAQLLADTPNSATGSPLTPLMIDVHYPSTTDLQQLHTAVTQLGGTQNVEGWNGEDWVTYLNGQNGGQPTAQQIASYGITSNAFGLDINCDGNDFSTSCKPSSSGVIQLISAFNSAYGQPQFFRVTITSTPSSTSTSTIGTTSSTTLASTFDSTSTLSTSTTSMSIFVSSTTSATAASTSSSTSPTISVVTTTSSNLKPPSNNAVFEGIAIAVALVVGGFLAFSFLMRRRRKGR